MELAPQQADSKQTRPRKLNMKKSSDRVARPATPLPPGRLTLDRPASVREHVPDYFTLYLLQELLSSIGWRHKH
jgi:hypothetical protein